MTYRRSRPRARRVSSRRPRGAPRRTVWIRSGESLGTIAQGAVKASNLISPSYLDPGARIGSTVTRIRMNIQVAFPGAYLDSISKAYVGVCVWPESDVALAPPHPWNGRNSLDWLAWEPISPAGADVVFVTTLPPTAGSVVNRDLDIKSQRVITEPGDTLVVAVYGDTTAASQITIFSHTSSVLLKLS